MTERETTRLIAWSTELRRVHARLRDALELTREAVSAGHSTEHAARDLLVYCHGFCAALDGHHQGEDRVLFPAIEQAHPHLTDVLRSLARDHSMIRHLVLGLRAAVERAASTAELERHLDGIAAIMESHFRYEEKALLEVLASLELTADPAATLGPL
ncbi:hemerythrin domain-containing protein [Microcella sp.]|uniref:hemerythrin domain-containing protein n=1 Tax=Microcella sp. TaxID=1913979 RepID=UPI002620B53D|nr:hemerythrin domain-containing protein [Microcella sp.]